MLFFLIRSKTSFNCDYLKARSAINFPLPIAALPMSVNLSFVLPAPNSSQSLRVELRSPAALIRQPILPARTVEMPALLPVELVAGRAVLVPVLQRPTLLPAVQISLPCESSKTRRFAGLETSIPQKFNAVPTPALRRTTTA